MEPLTLHAMGAGFSGPTSPSIASVTFLLATTDYFTEWIKVVPLSEVTGQQMVKFMWQNLICHFDLLGTIISNNRTNFTCREVGAFCVEYKIIHQFSMSYYPQGNGQADIGNHTILNRLCKSLGKVKEK